jgi:hypothetical protein
VEGDRGARTIGARDDDATVDEDASGGAAVLITAASVATGAAIGFALDPSGPEGALAELTTCAAGATGATATRSS